MAASACRAQCFVRTAASSSSTETSLSLSVCASCVKYLRVPACEYLAALRDSASCAAVSSRGVSGTRQGELAALYIDEVGIVSLACDMRTILSLALPFGR